VSKTSSYPGQSPNYVSDKDRRVIKKVEMQDQVGKPRQVYKSHVKKLCPDCGRVLKAKSASYEKDWITQCCWYHAWRVYFEAGTWRLEEIKTTDPRYPRRNIR